jgi:RING-variant domain
MKCKVKQLILVGSNSKSNKVKLEQKLTEDKTIDTSSVPPQTAKKSGKSTGAKEESHFTAGPFLFNPSNMDAQQQFPAERDGAGGDTGATVGHSTQLMVGRGGVNDGDEEVAVAAGNGGDADSNDAAKVCRICLDDDDQAGMIAPCRCSGGSKWVHRSCLDLWRVHEQDRAFSQCTECLYHYQFFAPADHRHRRNNNSGRRPSKQFWRRAKFCLFVSRDICVVTVLLQLVIALLGLCIRKIDKNEQLVSWLEGGNMSLCTDESISTFLWCHHQLTVYYLFGFVTVLAIIGVFGSVVLCKNGCTIPPTITSTTTNESFGSAMQDATTTKSRSTPLVAGLQQDQQQEEELHGRYQLHSTTDRHTPDDPRTQYYRRHRHRQQYRQYHSSGENECCGCCYRRPPGMMYSPYYCYDPCPAPLFYGPVPSTGDDCCCCCCDAPCCDGGDCNIGTGGGQSGGSGDCGDCAGILVLVVTVFLVIMAVIGFFVGVFLGVVLVQRVVQRHMFRLQKRHLVEEFQVADLAGCDDIPAQQNTTPIDSIYNAIPLPPPMPRTMSNLDPDDAAHLRKLGLLVDDYSPV